MPRFVRDPNRLNYTVSQTGKERVVGLMPYGITICRVLAKNGIRLKAGRPSVGSRVVQNA